MALHPPAAPAGCCFLFGGIKHKQQAFSALANKVGKCMGGRHEDCKQHAGYTWRSAWLSALLARHASACCRCCLHGSSKIGQALRPANGVLSWL